MKKAIFLDRDGVINRERGEYTYLIKDLEFNDGLIEALKTLKERGFIFIIITNQGGIAKRIYTHKDFLILNNEICERLEKEGIQITDTFYCPHHPDFGKCLCRKPGSLLLEKAIAMYNIDPTASYFIGDMERDIEAGVGAGVKTIKIDSNSSLLNIIDQVK